MLDIGAGLHEYEYSTVHHASCSALLCSRPKEHHPVVKTAGLILVRRAAPQTLSFHMEAKPPRNSRLRLASLRRSVGSLRRLQLPAPRARARERDGYRSETRHSSPVHIEGGLGGAAQLQPSLDSGRQEAARPLEGSVDAPAAADPAAAAVSELYTVQTVNGVLYINGARWDLDTAAVSPLLQSPTAPSPVLEHIKKEN